MLTSASWTQQSRIENVAGRRHKSSHQINKYHFLPKCENTKKKKSVTSLLKAETRMTHEGDTGTGSQRTFQIKMTTVSSGATDLQTTNGVGRLLTAGFSIKLHRKIHINLVSSFSYSATFTVKLSELPSWRCLPYEGCLCWGCAVY